MSRRERLVAARKEPEQGSTAEDLGVGREKRRSRGGEERPPGGPAHVMDHLGCADHDLLAAAARGEVRSQCALVRAM